MRITVKWLAAAFGLSVAVAPSVTAQPVQYSTQFSFTGTPLSFAPTASMLFGTALNGATLTFTGQPVALVTAPTFIDYGTVLASGVTGTGFNFAGQQIFLQILQTLPTVGNAVVVGAINGTIASNTQSNAIINWNTPSRFATIGPATYELERLSGGFTSINAPSAGVQTIRGYVTVSAVPEPASMTLLATGLVGVFGAARRRRKGFTAA